MNEKSFNLAITLPTKEARQNPGFFVLTDEYGAVLLTGFCLGKADNARAREKDNTYRISVLPYGDTPTGDYAPTKVVMFEQRHPRFGLGWIPIEGAAGDALKARMTKNEKGLPKRKRTGLGIHAGRGSDRLWATYGCVRLKDDDFSQLYALTGERVIEVSVVEAQT
jgi:L,D-transpeptidase-like protein